MPKICRRARTLTEASQPASELPVSTKDFTPVQLLHPLSSSYPELEGKNVDIFKPSAREKAAFDSFASVAITHMVLCCSCPIETSPSISDLPTYLGIIGGSNAVEKSTAAYLEVMDKFADSKETMLDVLTTFQLKLKVGETVNPLIVTGDAKTYCHIQVLKQEYGNQLSWVLPIIGDWHLIKNYQEILVHIYYDAGLKHFALAAGFRAKTLTHLQRCSNFQHAHHFQIDAWEAMLQHHFRLFVQSLPTSESAILQPLNSPLNSLVSTLDNMDSYKRELAERQGEL